MIDLSTVQFRKQIVSKWATKYELEVALVCALIEHESSWVPWATRFEEGFYRKYELNFKGTATEAYTRSMSWGLMQVMGETAREYGFSGKYLSELTDPDVGIDFGCRKLQRCIRRTTTIQAALLQYNGGSAPEYPNLVLQYKSKYF